MTDRELMQMALDALEEVNKLSIGEKAICCYCRLRQCNPSKG